MADLSNSTGLINLYCGSLRNVIAQHNAEYVFTETPEGYSCELSMPFNSPVKGGSSNGSFRSKKLAKQSAALAVVEQLILAGEFDAQLNPTPANPAKQKGDSQPDSNSMKTTIESQRNAARAGLDGHKEVGVVGMEGYKSLLWSNNWKPIGDESKLHGLTVNLNVEGVDSVPECRTLVFLTVDEAPIVPVDVSAYETTARLDLKHTRSFKLSAEQRAQAFAYTRRLLQAMTNQRVESKLEDTPILLLPLRRDYTPKHRAKDSDVDWTEVQRPAEHEKLSEDPAELEAQLEDAIVAFGDFNRKFTATPDGTGEDGKMQLRVSQFFSAKRGGVVGSLTKKAETDVRPAKDLHKTSVSASAMRTATLLPSLVAQLNDRLVAAEATRLLGGTLTPELVLEALCPPGARTAQDTASHGHENYERLEILGDTLLKLFATLDVFDLAKSEGAMTRARHGSVSNKALKIAALKSGIVPFIRSAKRKHRDVVPPGWVTLPLGHAEEELLVSSDNFIQLPIGDKTMADVAEALLGAAYLCTEGGDDAKLQAALDIAHRLNIPLKMKRFPASRSPVEGTTLKDYVFRDPKTADVIVSPRKGSGSFGHFEMFEFLGDAVIDYITMTHLWSAYPDASPAQLTIMKHSRVSNAALGAYTATVGLHHGIAVDDPSQEERVAQFAAQVSLALGKAKKRREGGGTVDEFWSQVPEYKFMGDILEARLGAIYHDSGSLVLCKALFEPARKWIDAYALNPKSKNAKPHPKSALLERLAKAGCHGVKVEKVDPLVASASTASSSSKDGYGALVTIHGKTLAGAVGKTPQLAQRAACDMGLERLEGFNWSVCTCKTGRGVQTPKVDVDPSRISVSPAKRGRDAGSDPAATAPTVPAGEEEPVKKRKKSKSNSRSKSQSPQA